jgi:hypothetical protein
LLDLLAVLVGTSFTVCCGTSVPLQVFDYLNCIKTYLHYIDEQPSLFWNEPRPDISCEGI